MIGLIRGFFGGMIAAATMAGGLRAIGRGERVGTEWLVQRLLRAADTLLARPVMSGLKGGEKAPCPGLPGAHHFARCPQCGKRMHEHR